MQGPIPVGRNRRQRGSAYVVALLVLVVLTILGLALVLITQTEMQIGGNEMTINRTLYAADSGISLGLAKVFANNDTSPSGVVLNHQHAPELRDQVAVSSFLPISDSTCNLCSINQGSTYETVNHLVSSTATRQGVDTNVPIAQRSVSMTVALQPWEGNNEAAERADPEGNEGSILPFDSGGGGSGGS